MRTPTAGLTLILSLFFYSFAQASPTAEALFESLFYTHYEARFCGKNIMRFLDEAQKQELDFSRARMVHIENGGGSIFGLINAELARGGGRDGLPGQANWYHHVIMELDCKIYDFDFMSEPTVLSMGDYFEAMFLNDHKKPGEYDANYAGREEKLKRYLITTYRGQDYYNNRGTTPVEESKIPLVEFLRQCP